jgi:large subunit ribosomal protein L11
VKKKLVAVIKLEIPAGKANPAPPIGPALGQRGLNIMEFCKQFNERTKEAKVGTPTPVIINAYADKSFDFITKTPPVSFYIKEFAGIASGSKTAGRATVGQISVEKVMEIAKIKMNDMGVEKIESAINMVKGTARSMGIEVLGG